MERCSRVCFFCQLIVKMMIVSLAERRTKEVDAWTSLLFLPSFFKKDIAGLHVKEANREEAFIHLLLLQLWFLTFFTSLTMHLSHPTIFGNIGSIFWKNPIIFLMVGPITSIIFFLEKSHYLTLPSFQDMLSIFPKIVGMT